MSSSSRYSVFGCQVAYGRLFHVVLSFALSDGIHFLDTYLAVDSLEFKFQGNPVQMADDTPNSIGMCDDQNTIQVSLTGIERTKEIISQACVDGMISLAVELLSANKELCAQNVRWLDHEGEEMLTPPIFIGIDYGHVELVSNLLPLHYGGVIDTMRAGCGDYTALEWACWVVRPCYCRSDYLLIHFGPSVKNSHCCCSISKGIIEYCEDIGRRGGSKSY